MRPISEVVRHASFAIFRFFRFCSKITERGFFILLDIIWAIWWLLSQESAGPCLSRAGCGFRIPFAFRQSSFMLSAVSLLLLSRVQGSEMWWLSVATRPTRDPIHLQISINFQACLRGSKNQKSCSQGLQKNNKNAARNQYKTISANNWCLQYFPCENLDSWAPSVQMSTQKSIKKWPGTKPENKMPPC